VSSSGNVLLVARSFTVEIYGGSDAKLIRRITLPRDMIDIYHAVETSSGNILVCHGRNTKTQDGLKRVCELTPEGVMIRSFGGKQGLGDNSLDNPLALAIDAEGNVYVPDTGNRRVVILDSTLNLRGVILTRNEREKIGPIFVSYSPETRQLMVLLSKLEFYEPHTELTSHVYLDILRVC